MSSSTPLLLLLDSVLSQNVDRIQEARREIYTMAQEAGYGTDGTESDSSIPSASSSLAEDVNKLLTGYPHLASVPSIQDGSLPLHFAASIGNVEVARLIMSKFPRAATTPNTKGKIPLHYAAREGRTDMVVFFLQTTPQTAQIPSKKQKLALHFAAGDGHVEVVRQLLSVYPQGASFPSSKGKLPIHFASRWGNLQIVADLLYVYTEGIHAADYEGTLPLHEAAREGQFQMSKFLVERFPSALSTTDIRGETPLFAAVRSGNVDLVILYLQAWPHGGRHILKSVTPDDNVGDWDPRILELLLRSAVTNFIGCKIINGKDPPTYFGMRKYLQSNSETESASGDEIDSEIDGSDQDSDNEAECPLGVDGAISIASSSVEAMANADVAVPSSAAVPPPTTTANVSTNWNQRQGAELDDQTNKGDSAKKNDNTRSKSPVIDEEGNSKKRPLDTKRDKKTHDSDGESEEKKPKCRKRTYLPLHAALDCEASAPVLRCVLSRGSDSQLKKVDDNGQLPLHLAVAHCKEEETIQILLDEILKPYPEAASRRDNDGRLPLHAALMARADFRITQALIGANSSSAVDVCETDIECFKDKMPIFMATEYDCDLSTTYLLFRLEPSVMHDWNPALYTARRPF